MDPLCALCAAGTILQITELGKKIFREYSLLADSGHRFNEIIISLKTAMDESAAHLRLLQLKAKGGYMEYTIIQCYKDCEDISRLLKASNLAEHPKKIRYVFDKLNKLTASYQRMPALVLRSMRGWHIQEHQCSQRGISKNSTKISTKTRVNSFLSHSGPLGPRIFHQLSFKVQTSDSEQCKMKLKNDILNEIYDGTGHMSSQIRMLDPIWEKALEQSFLQRLHYPGMRDRKVAISSAHSSSFSWIFDPQMNSNRNDSNLLHWISSSEPLFWIKGKAGSGKSTLMKHIFENCNSYQRNTMKANFVHFFEHTGHPMQRNLNGFLRSVLFQLLSRNSNIIHAVAPSRWEALFLFGEDPKPLDVAELQQMLLSTLHQCYGQSRANTAILFIDALDECEDHSGYLEILELLDKMRSCPGIKICISSRPLPQFRDFIGSAPGFDLENLTRRDIEKFAISEFEAHISKTPGVSIGLGVKETLVNVITQKASGCFLWAALVVKSLQQCLSARKGDDDLLVFLQNVPVGLNELIRSFVHELDASQSSMASILRFVGLSREPVSALQLYFMQMNFPEFVLRQQIAPWARETLSFHIQKTIEKLVAGSKGLLEVVGRHEPISLERLYTDECDARVTLIHPSVRAFLEKEAKLRTSAPHRGTYDLAARHCAASLSLLKVKAISDLTVHSVSIGALECAYMAMFTQAENEENMMQILDELEYTCQALLEGATSAKPGSDIERDTATRYYVLTDGFWERSNNLCETASPIIRHRAIILCSKYNLSMPRQASEKAGQWPTHLKDVDHDFTVAREVHFERQPSDICLHGHHPMSTEERIMPSPNNAGFGIKDRELNLAFSQAHEKTVAQRCGGNVVALQTTTSSRRAVVEQWLCGMEDDRYEPIWEDAHDYGNFIGVELNTSAANDNPRVLMGSDKGIERSGTNKIEDTNYDGIQETVCVERISPRMPSAQFSGTSILSEREAHFDDESDQMSWESLSYTNSSLDEDHPLVNLKAEVVEAVFQGYMEYRKKLIR
ncbi:hypothetical protein F4777DRAFT_401145 [Nemania sp. FL0916]|nr:hypothetical protein F4777DRAFT_401145 [Nemania sp. FL0916]